MTVEEIAEVCHGANRAYCRAIGDMSQPEWDRAPEWQRDSAIKGVEFVLEHPDAPISALHDNWLADKHFNGWKYGPVKDPEKKEHPCFVPWNQLPPEQQAKDKLFSAIVRALAD